MPIVNVKNHENGRWKKQEAENRKNERGDGKVTVKE